MTIDLKVEGVKKTRECQQMMGKHVICSKVLDKTGVTMGIGSEQVCLDCEGDEYSILQKEMQNMWYKKACWGCTQIQPGG